MSDCEITTSVFSAGANSPSGVPKGWLGEAADQLVNGKRYVGVDAIAAATDPTLNTTKGHISNIIHDCTNDCEVYGSTFSRAGDGKLKARATVSIGGCGSVFPCGTAMQLSYAFTTPCLANCGNDAAMCQAARSSLPTSVPRCSPNDCVFTIPPPSSYNCGYELIWSTGGFLSAVDVTINFDTCVITWFLSAFFFWNGTWNPINSNGIRSANWNSFPAVEIVSFPFFLPGCAFNGFVHFAIT